MRVLVASLLAGSLVAAPAVAGADGFGCLVGPSDVNPCSFGGSPAAILGAVAAPVIIAGAAVTVANELGRRTEERAPDGSAATKTAGGKHAAPSLALVPDPPDPYRAAGGKPETRAKPSGAFQFNETATNVATAVTGAMVVGAIIADIVHETHHK